jgi:hypothetical protein
MPNECWQADFTHYPLVGGADTEILTWSRRPLPVRPVRHRPQRVTGPAVLLAFRAACEQHGVPASTLTDNGMVFTTRLSGGRGGRNALEHELRRLGVTQKNGKPQTQGKIERFQQTMKNWLRAQPHQPATAGDLQTLLDAFSVIYNTRRPHRSLPGRATPATAFAARPKAVPGDRAADTHDRARTDRIDATGLVTPRRNGQLHHIGTGRPTPEPASGCWSRTCTSAPSTPAPANSFANSSSTRTSATSPPASHQAGQRKPPQTLCRFAVSSMSCDTTWWQVLGSNQRRLSRRFYRPLIPANRNSCRPADTPFPMA